MSIVINELEYDVKKVFESLLIAQLEFARSKGERFKAQKWFIEKILELMKTREVISTEDFYCYYKNPTFRSVTAVLETLKKHLTQRLEGNDYYFDDKNQYTLQLHKKPVLTAANVSVIKQYEAKTDDYAKQHAPEDVNYAVIIYKISKTRKIFAFLHSEPFLYMLLTIMLGALFACAINGKYLLLVAIPLFAGTAAFTCLASASKKRINIKIMPVYLTLTAFYLIIMLVFEKIDDPDTKRMLLVASSMLYFMIMHYYLKIVANLKDWTLTTSFVAASLIIMASLYWLALIIYNNPASLAVVIPYLTLSAVFLSWCKKMIGKWAAKRKLSLG